MIGSRAAAAGRRVWFGMGATDDSPLTAVLNATGNAGAADNVGRAGRDPVDAAARDLRGKSVLLLLLNAGLIGWILLSPAKGLAQRLPVAAAVVLASLIAVPWSLSLALKLWRGRWRDGCKGLFRRGTESHDAARRACAAAFTLAFAAILSGQIACYHYELSGDKAPFPSLADAGYLLAYPFLIAGVLLLPARRLTGVQRGRVLMDSCMTLVAAATFSWYFLLGPTLLTASQNPLQKVLAAGYPVGDLLVLFCLLLTVARVRGAKPPRGIMPMCLGLLVVVVTDVVSAYQSLHSAYVPGTAVDAGWPLGFMIMALGARGILLAKKSAADGGNEGSREAVAESGIETMLPYALVPMVGALVLGTLQEHNTALVGGVYVGAAAIILLIVLRQVLTIRQNFRLYAELSRAYGQLAQSHQSLTAANLTLAQTEERFRAAAESASDLIYEIDYDTGGLEWFGDVHGHQGVGHGGLPETLRAWEQMIHPEDRERVLGAVRRHLESGERYEVEYRVAAGEDKYRDWLDRGRVIHRDGVAPRRAVGAVSDI